MFYIQFYWEKKNGVNNGERPFQLSQERVALVHFNYFILFIIEIHFKIYLKFTIF